MIDRAYAVGQCHRIHLYVQLTIVSKADTLNISFLIDRYMIRSNVRAFSCIFISLDI
jgi:hypothetical protein